MNHLLHKETGSDVYNADSINGKFNVFIETFQHYFDIAFPLKTFKQNSTCLKKNG